MGNDQRVSEQATKLSCNAGPGLLRLPAIKLLKADIGRIEGKISSNTLEELHYKDIRDEDTATHPSSVTGILGRLPRLRLLYLSSSYSDDYSEVSSTTGRFFGRQNCGQLCVKGHLLVRLQTANLVAYLIRRCRAQGVRGVVFTEGGIVLTVKYLCETCRLKSWS